MQMLLNRRVIITGAGSGIGKAIVDRFLQEGAKVLAVVRKPEQIEAFISQSKDPAAINAARNVQMYKMRQDPKYADILRNKDMSEIKWAVGEGLLGALPVGKIVQKVGGKILPGLADNGLAVAPKLVDDVAETLKRANDFNKIGIWRELRSRGVEVTEAMVEEILRKGKILPAR